MVVVSKSWLFCGPVVKFGCREEPGRSWLGSFCTWLCDFVLAAEACEVVSGICVCSDIICLLISSNPRLLLRLEGSYPLSDRSGSLWTP